MTSAYARTACAAALALAMTGPVAAESEGESGPPIGGLYEIGAVVPSTGVAATLQMRRSAQIKEGQIVEVTDRLSWHDGTACAQAPSFTKTDAPSLSDPNLAPWLGDGGTTAAWRLTCPLDASVSLDIHVISPETFIEMSRDGSSWFVFEPAAQE